MPYNPGTQDISGQLLGQGIAQFGQGVASGIEQYGARKEKEQNIIAEANGRGRALQSAFSNLEKLGIVPEGFSAQIKSAQESMAPRDFLGFADQTSKKFETIVQGGVHVQQIQAQKAKDDALVKAMQVAGGAVEASFNPDGTLNIPKAMQIYRSSGGTDINILAKAVDLAAGPASLQPTAAMRDTEAVIASQGKAGTLDTNDPVAVAKRRAELIAQGGRDPAEKYFNAGVFVDRETGGSPVQASREASSGRVGMVDDKGKFQPLDMSRFKPTTASDANVFMQEADMKKLSDTIVDQENSIKALNRYAKTAGGLPQGIEKIGTRISAAVKTSVTQEPLSEEEKAMGISSARKERLLGALRTTVLGPGVLTENDASRLINAIGGDINSILTNPEVVQETVQELLSEKMNSYKQNLQIYNRHVVGRYSQAGYEQRQAVEPYKPEAKTEAAGGDTKVIGGVTYVKTANGWERK